MKKILLVLLSGIMTLAVTAQTITITFNGTNNTRNYQVILDGTSYYSNSTVDANSNTNVRKEITLTNQQLGSHTIEIYRLRNTGTYTNGTNTQTYGRVIYTKDFQLREGYDMNIAVNGNGQVTFSERRMRNQGRHGGRNRETVTPMADATFNQLVQSVRSSWTQSSRFTKERNAFLITTNYFTTDQVRQLLTLITSESNRVTLAKLAYPRVSDPTNFTMLYDVFNSVASRDDMNNFIRNNPNYNNSGSGNYGNNNYGNNNYGNNNNNGYRTPMADYQFSQLLQTINSQYSQSGKYTAISGAFNNSSNYFTTAQVRQMLSLITTESDRLVLAKQSYLRVTDAGSFTTLYDLFYNQSSRNDLNNYVIQNGGTGTTVQYNNRTPMSDATFNQVLQKVSNHFLPWDKVRDARDAFNNTSYYFTTSQVRQILNVIASENDKLELAKLAWSRVTDPAYFTQLFDLFTTQAYRDDLNAYIQAHPF
jgi:hypothetical protein